MKSNPYTPKEILDVIKQPLDHPVEILPSTEQLRIETAKFLAKCDEYSGQSK